MAARTRSSSPPREERRRNGAALVAVVVGVLAVVTLPAAVAAAQLTEEVELPDAAFAIPVAAALGITAYLVGRRAQRRVERTIGRVGGRRVAWTGKALGALALAVSTSAAVAVATYVVLGRLAD